MLSQTLGGLGLFLMGMWLMTEGLREAAGPALKRILARWTSSAFRGFLTGFGLTSLVQSSSAVTVATIGFANAGFLTLSQAVWVIYGTNLGTTMTGWIVSVFGFRLDIAAAALPMVGLGMILRLASGQSRRAGLGTALAGFGVLFLGIEFLKAGFETAAAGMTLPAFAPGSLAGTLVYVGIGTLLSLLMQSSSAAMVVALSAVSSGLLDLEHAAALIIGANIGTTATAMIAAWGATPVARRVASSHVAFNLVAAGAALALLPHLLAAITWLTATLGFTTDPAIALALFHTAFNILGVLLIWPLTPALVRLLENRFLSQEEDESRLRYLDQTVLAVPALGIAAALKETRRLRDLATRAIGAWLAAPDRPDRLPAAIAAAHALAGGIAEFLARLTTQPISPREAAEIQGLMRALQHCVAALEDAGTARGTLADVETVPPQRIELEHRIRALLARPGEMTPENEAGLLAHREEIKDELVHLAALHALSIDSLDHALRGMNAELRMLRHLRKAHEHLDRAPAPEGPAPPENGAAPPPPAATP